MHHSLLPSLTVSLKEFKTPPLIVVQSILADKNIDEINDVVVVFP